VRKRPGTTGDDQEWPGMTLNDRKWLGMTNNDRKWPFNDQEWQGLAGNDQEWQGMAGNNCKQPGITRNYRTQKFLRYGYYREIKHDISSLSLKAVVQWWRWRLVTWRLQILLLLCAFLFSFLGGVAPFSTESILQSYVSSVDLRFVLIQSCKHKLAMQIIVSAEHDQKGFWVCFSSTWSKTL